MDTITASITLIPDPSSREFAWIVAFSGISRDLTKSGFNLRVVECRQSSPLLKDGARILSDVPGERFEERKRTLPENLFKRAEHYFSEVKRVHQGVNAWKDGDLELFGQLMNKSCESSIKNSVMFIFPPEIWRYLPKVQEPPSDEIGLQSAVQMMIEDEYKAIGLLQPAPQEWTPEHIGKTESD